MTSDDEVLFDVANWLQIVIIACKCVFKLTIKIMCFDQACRNPIKNNTHEMMCPLEAHNLAIHVHVADWQGIAKRDQQQSKNKTTF